MNLQKHIKKVLKESFNQIRARRLLNIADEYIQDLNPKDVCNYWESDEVDDYVTETMAEIVRVMLDEYRDIDSDDWHDTYEGVYRMLDNLDYAYMIREFFYDSLNNCNKYS